MKQKILLVDNDKFFRELIADMLNEEGFGVETASDGIEVIEKIHEIQPDAIVLDLIMENFSGDQVVKFLKRNADYRNLPIIILSGVASKKIKELDGLDADIFIPKSDPQTMKKALLHNLKAVLKKSEPPQNVDTSKVKKEAQEFIISELIQKSNILKTILDSLSEGIIACDSNFKITYSNSGLQKILNLSQEKTIGQDLKEFLIGINARPMIIEDILKPDMEFISKNFELFYRDKVLKVKASYFQIKNKFAGVLMVFSDMTEQKTLEKKISAEFEQRTNELENTYKELHKANLELIKASEVKSEFVANVSHELRSPLNDIMGFVQLLQSKIYGPTTEKQDEALMHIMQNSNTLLKMINEILDVTKIEKDQMPLVTSEIHPREIIEFVIGGFTWIGEAKKIDVEVFYSNKLPQIETDVEKLKRILINLLDNSVKFTEKGHIYLKCEDIQEEKSIQFIVEDTGIGLSKSDMNIIFQPFTQLESSTTKRFGGVGLGLYIVKKLVEMIKGTIRVESQKKKGTTFYIKIPYRMKEEA